MEDALQILLQYGYLMLFIGMILDSSGIPFPGDLLLFAAGYLVYHGEMSLPVVIVVASVAVLTGDSVTFSLGKAVCRAQGTFLLRVYCRWTKCTYSSTDCFQRACATFNSFGKKSLILSKFMWGVREFLPPVAGLSGMRFLRFLALDAIGVILWVVSFVLVGRFLGTQAETFLGTVQNVLIGLGILIAVTFALLLGIKTVKRSRLGKMTPTTEIPAQLIESDIKAEAIRKP